MADTARFPYTGTALPLAEATVVIFDTVAMFQGGNMCPQMGYKRLQIDIFNDQAVTVNWYKSRGHRGATSALTTWDKLGSQAFAAVAAGATNTQDLLMEEYEEFKVEVVVGASNLGVFDVDVALTDSRNKGT